MRYVADTTELQVEEPTIITLGRFDGRHRGYQKFLLTIQELKSNLRYLAAIFTFSTLPLSMMNG